MTTKWISFLGVLLLTIGAYGQASDSAVFVQNIQQATQDIKTLKAEYKQVKESALFLSAQKSSGYFCYDDGNIRWEQQQPSTYIILLQEENVKIKEGEKTTNLGKQGSRQLQQLKTLIQGCVNGSIIDDKRFNASCDVKHQSITLIPNDKRIAKLYSRIVLQFDPQSHRVTSFTFEEENGDQTRIAFSNEQINLPLSPSVFTSF